MGYSFPEKNLAILLYALTGGDRVEADLLWGRILFEEFNSWQDAWDWLEEWFDDE